MISDVRLRDLTETDLPIFYDHQLDPVATQMAAFPSRTERDFMRHWRDILVDETITKQTILVDGQIAGNVLCFVQSGEPHIGYWLDRAFWGKGVASRALAAFLALVNRRPLYAIVAKRNPASLRVLEKCDFAIIGEEMGFPDADGHEVDEYILRLDGQDQSPAR